MSEIIVSEYQRGIAEVTQDIRRETVEFLMTAIRIGRLLFEAKAMVEPGCWTRYIEEELPFSHSWANNYMKLYKEYGSDQMSMFGDSQAFAKLRPTQALELLALPAEDRLRFVQENDVENMSTRELRRAIKERDEAREELDEVRIGKDAAEQRVEDLEEELAEAKRMERAQQEAAQLARDAQIELNEELEKARKQAERKEKEAEKARQQLEEAKKNAESAKEQLEKLKANPKIPAAMMQQMRLEVEQEAARKATVDLQKQLDAAVAERTSAVEKARELETKLSDAQRAAKLSDPAVTKAVVLAERAMTEFNAMYNLKQEQLAAGNLKTAESIGKILIDMAAQMTRIAGA